MSTVSTVDSRKKSKSATFDKSDKKKSKAIDARKSKRTSMGSFKHSSSGSLEPSVLKYTLDFGKFSCNMWTCYVRYCINIEYQTKSLVVGGCELCSVQRRSVVMVNNSEKVYKFEWVTVEHICIKPSMGYISPGEEKDLEIMFFSPQPVLLKKVFYEIDAQHFWAILHKIFTSNQLNQRDISGITQLHTDSNKWRLIDHRFERSNLG